MPLIGAAAITGAAAIGGGVIAAKGAKNAAKTQEAAAREAIAYQERTQRERQSRYDAAMQDYTKRYDAWLEQFYGVKPQGRESGGVHASSGMGDGVGASVSMSAAPVSAGTVSQFQQGDTIADLIRGIGAIRANGQMGAGNAWGNALTTAGAGIGKAVGSQPQKPQATLTGSFQPTGVTPGAAGTEGLNLHDLGGWSDWNNYLYQGGA